MTVPELRATLHEANPPQGLSLLAEALWWDAKGDWKRAHTIFHVIGSPDA